MIYTGFGNECTIIKRSGIGRVIADELLTVRRSSDGAELDYYALELKADNGLIEIVAAIEALEATNA